jgi:arabinofuranosyltransferase
MPERPSHNGSSDGKRNNRVTNWHRILWLIALLLLVFHCMIYWNTMVDDAFISFRYSENWALGHGPVYNAGERVEGVTNMLWVAILAIPAALNMDLTLVSRILGIMLTVGSFVLVIYWSRSILEKSSDLWAAFLIASSAPIACWATGGLETPLFAFLVLAAMIRAFREEDRDRQGWLSGILFALAGMTRPEGFLFWGGFVLFRLIESITGSHRWRASDWQRIFGFLVLAIPFVLARWIYYGNVFPNTFYVKTGRGLRGILGGGRYTLEFLSAFGGGVLIGIGLLSLLDARKRRWMAYCLGISGLFAAYVVLLGGADWMALFRYYVPVIPLLIIPISLGFGMIGEWLTGGRLPGSESIPSWRKNIAILFIGILIVVFNLQVTYLVRFRDVKHYGGFDDYHRYLKAVEYMIQHSSKDALIAVQNAGTVPYFTQRRTIDMSGLADKHIAHTEAKGKLKRRYDADYILSRKPDYVEILSGMDLSKEPYQNPDPGIQELLTRPGFASNYRPIPGFSGPGVALFQRIKPETPLP